MVGQEKNPMSGILLPLKSAFGTVAHIRNTAPGPASPDTRRVSRAPVMRSLAKMARITLSAHLAPQSLPRERKNRDGDKAYLGAQRATSPARRHSGQERYPRRPPRHRIQAPAAQARARGVETRRHRLSGGSGHRAGVLSRRSRGRHGRHHGDGRTVEVGIIGREGLVGINIFLGGVVTPTRRSCSCRAAR